MLELLPPIKQRFFDLNGAVLAGGKLWSYIAGTSTPSATFQDSSGSTPNTNPIILDSSGYANVWVTVGGGSYKFVLTDANDVVQFTIDNVSPSGPSAVTGWGLHAVTDGMALTDMIGETVDMSLYSSAKYDVEIIRGATTFAGGPLEIQNVAGTARVVTGMFLCNEDHGVTFAVSQVGLVATLRASTSTGPGSGTIKLSRRLVPA